MAREFKFRAWNKEYKEMVSWSHLCNDTYYGLIFGMGCLDEDDQFDYMQYTGLEDKNGTEIYEGDIVKGKRFEKGTFVRTIGKVDFIPCTYVINGIGKYKGIIDEISRLYEVIGNIYENPELLEDANNVPQE